jgi:AcrR family transcriptional regulator
MSDTDTATASDAASADAATGRARGPYRTGIRRRQQILDAATIVFGRRGYGTASLRMIADEVGVTPAALLRHFDSKEDLLLAVLDRFDEQSAALQVLTAHGSGLDYFDALALAMDRHREHPGLIELLLTMCTEASDSTHPAHAWVVRRYDRIVREASGALLHAAEAGDIAPLSEERAAHEARALFAIMDGLELQWIANPELDLGALFRPVYEYTLARWRRGA